MPDHRAATVEFDHVTKVYDAAAAAAGGPGSPARSTTCRFHVPAGRICVLVGPSGCGKTTSLQDGQPAHRADARADPDRRRRRRDPRRRRELRRGIGYVIQQVGLFPHQTIADNVATVPRLLGWDRRARRRERADELLDLVGLDPAACRERYPSAALRRPAAARRASPGRSPPTRRCMLMDEPFGAVDPIVRERLQDELLRLQAELRKTILFVTHDIDEAIKMGDLVAVLEDGGRLAQFGPPAGILAEPASEFVARFVGADRGLKRLSLARVGDLALTAAGHGPAGRGCARRPAPASSRARLRLPPAVDEVDRPIGWIERADMPVDGRLDARSADADVARSSTAARRSRTPSRCSSTPTSRPASWSTGDGRVVGPRHRRRDLGLDAMAAGAATRPAGSRGPASEADG